MNKTITYFLIMLFVFQSTSNFWIVFSFYLNQDYIAQEVCINRFDKIPVCNGVCYLGEQLSKNEEKEQKNTNATFNDIKHYTQAKNEIDVEFTPSIKYQKATIFSKNELKNYTYIHSIFHPPKQVDLI